MASQITKQDIVRVLDYWRFMDMLTQEQIPRAANGGLYSHGSKCEISARIPNGIHTDFGSLIHQWCSKAKTNGKRAQRCSEIGDGDIRVYVGSVPRDPFIRYIARKTKNQNHLHEREVGRIPLGLIHLSADGTLKNGRKGLESGIFDLEVSPTLWFAKQVGIDGLVADDIDVDKYQTWVAGINKRLVDQLGNGVVDVETIREFNKKAFGRLYNQLSQRGFELQPKDYQSAVMSLQLNFMAYTKDGLPQNPQPIHLAASFYAEDIEAVREAISPQSMTPTIAELERSSLGPLIHYLEAALNGEAPDRRVDMLHDSIEVLRTCYETVNDPDNTPLGRWPSQYGLALMQQCAVNLTVGRHRDACYGLLSPRGTTNVPSDVMSVNGPPGTGKTTLLKDVVAANVVERAALLSKFDNPDELFVKHSYQHDDEHGGQYIAGFPGTGDFNCYYSIKPEYDALNDLGIVVCSSNNAAVENISTELPKGSDLIDGLVHKGQTPQSVIDDLILNLSSSTEHDSPLGYWSDYALSQFKKKGETGTQQNLKSTCDMLLTARLGNKGNIDAFNRQSLFPIIRDFCRKADRAQWRQGRYLSARRAFVAQYQKVSALSHATHNRISDANENALHELQAHLKENTTNQQRLELRQSSLMEKHETLLSEALSGYARFAETIHVSFSTVPKDSNGLMRAWRYLRVIAATFDELDQLEREMRSDVSGKYRLFQRRYRKEHQQEHLRLENDLKSYWRYLGGDEPTLVSIMHDAAVRADLQRYLAEVERIIAELESLADDLRATATLKDDCLRLQKELEAQLRYANAKLQSARAAAPVHKATSDGALSETYERVTDAFLADLKADISNARKRAHLSNLGYLDPQTNSDKEHDLPYQRGLLFFSALHFLEEFVRSSDAMQCNLRNLHAMWGGKDHHSPGSKSDERIVFDPEDRRDAMPYLLQSLFILTPVVSTTFASAHRLFEDVPIDGKGKAPFGLLIVDEAGQAVPEAVVGVLARCRRALVVGDPQQIAPVVTSDLRLLRGVWQKSLGSRFVDITSEAASVQLFADRCNPFGSMNEGGMEIAQWVGCPLVVHRRCISPMFDISNEISYGGSMLNETRDASVERKRTFCLPSSQWINIAGSERSASDHYVSAQGQQAIKLVEDAFKRMRRGGSDSQKADSGDNGIPSIYVISPFKTIVSGLKSAMRQCARDESRWGERWNTFIERNIGTVHTFQGKEADQVILLLGCSAQSKGAVRWVDSNLFNVAASRAKYRLYVIGDYRVWQENEHCQIIKKHLDTQWVMPLYHAAAIDDPDQRNSALEQAALLLPLLVSFPLLEGAQDKGPESHYLEADTKSFVTHVDAYLREHRLSDWADAICDRCSRRFGYAGLDELQHMYDRYGADESKYIVMNLRQGMLIYETFGRVFPLGNAFSYLVAFYSALDIYLRTTLWPLLKRIEDENPSVKGKPGSITERSDRISLGRYPYIINDMKYELAWYCNAASDGDDRYGLSYWKRFVYLLKSISQNRNEGSHPTLDIAIDRSYAQTAIKYIFMGDEMITPGPMRETKVFSVLKKGLDMGVAYEPEKASTSVNVCDGPSHAVRPHDLQAKQATDSEKEAPSVGSPQEKRVRTEDDHWPKSIGHAIAWALKEGLWMGEPPKNYSSINKQLQHDLRIIYQDSEGNWTPLTDELAASWGIEAKIWNRKGSDKGRKYCVYTKLGFQRILKWFSTDKEKRPLSLDEIRIICLAERLKRLKGTPGSCRPVDKEKMNQLLHKPLPKWANDPAFARIITCGTLAEVPDETVAREIDSLLEAGLLQIDPNSTDEGLIPTEQGWHMVPKNKA